MRRVGLAGVLVLSATLFVGMGCGGSGSPKPPTSAARRMNAEGLRRLERGDAAGAEEVLREALREGELVDDLVGQAEAWNNLGALASARGAPRYAWAMHAAALRMYGAAGKRDHGEVRTRVNLGGAMLSAGQPAAARQEFEEAIKLAGALGDPRAAFVARVGLASITLSVSPKDAARDAGLVATDARAAGDDAALAAALSVEGAGFELSSDLVAATARYEEALEIDRKREQPRAVAADLAALARVAERSGNKVRAAALLGRSARVARRLGQLDLAEAQLARAIELAHGTDEEAALRIEKEAVHTARERERERERSSVKARPIDPDPDRTD